MATPMALKTNHIHKSALGLKTLTWSDLKGWQLLLGSSELIPVSKKLATLSRLSPLPSRLRVRLMKLIDMRFSMFNSLIDPL